MNFYKKSIQISPFRILFEREARSAIDLLYNNPNQEKDKLTGMPPEWAAKHRGRLETPTGMYGNSCNSQ